MPLINFCFIKKYIKFFWIHKWHCLCLESKVSGKSSIVTEIAHAWLVLKTCLSASFTMRLAFAKQCQRTKQGKKSCKCYNFFSTSRITFKSELELGFVRCCCCCCKLQELRQKQRKKDWQRSPTYFRPPASLVMLLSLLRLMFCYRKIIDPTPKGVLSFIDIHFT